MTIGQIIRGPLVEAPNPARRSGGLLDVAEVRDGISYIDSNDMFVSWNCIENQWTTVCTPDSTPTKTFLGPTMVDGANFVGYLGGQCKPLGTDTEANISRVFDLRESRIVEKRFETAILGAGTAVAGSPVSAAHALGMMENALGDQYAGVGTIHMSPLMATLLLQNQLLLNSGGKFFTQLGTKVVVGTGYSSTAMYGTGDVVVYRSQKVLVDAPDMTNNVTSVLAERAYVVVADCVSLKMTGIPMPASQQTGDPGGPVTAITGSDTVAGTAGTWTPPSGQLRNVSIVVTSGSATVNGDVVTAPNTVNFDADTNETLSPPTVTTSGAGDNAVVSWTVIP